MDLRIPIIPSKQTFASTNAPHELHLEAICSFAAIGFFLDKDSYWKDQIVLSPSTNYLLDDMGFVQKSDNYFKWYYDPQDINFETALDQFTDLLESIILEQSNSKKVILPLSGGLDSRTQAAALKHINADVFSYSYDFKNGYKESKIAKKIADISKFEFQSYTINAGYLWKNLDKLADINNCYSDFTTPRQMAIYDEYSKMGDVFSLGHWGDVLFDNMGLTEKSHDEQIHILVKKLIKRGGLEFASDLWKQWNLSGDFKSYFYDRISSLLDSIDIDNTNAKLRAFKSKYWAPRWTSINLSIFESHAPIRLPYYDDRMCNFICRIPEEFLQNRRLQIEYVKRRAPELAKITWEDQRPFNLNNYNYNKIPFNIPYRVSNKIKRLIKSSLGSSYVQRNWELQFIGSSNEEKLGHYLFDNGLDQWISPDLTRSYFEAFTTVNKLQNAHPINMLLVMSKFNERQSNA